MKSNMSKILILGCSFTQGHTKPNENSWSWQLSQRHPHIEFLDCSKGGSSIQWAAFCLECVTNYDWVIAQYTSPYRLSLWPDEWALIEQCRTSRSNNYSTWDNDQLELYCDFASSGWLGTPRYGWPGNSEPKVPFVRDYFTHLAPQHHVINYSAVAQALHSKVDFGFKWCSRDPLDNVPCVQDIIPNFEQLTIDDYDHLGIPGSKLVADWVEDSFLKPNGII
jgi:hypothetical protein